MERRVKILGLLCLMAMCSLAAGGQQNPDLRDGGEKVPQKALLSLRVHAPVQPESTPGFDQPAEARQEDELRPGKPDRIREEATAGLSRPLRFLEPVAAGALEPDRSRQEQLIILSELIRVQKEPPLALQQWMICCTDWRKAVR